MDHHFKFVTKIQFWNTYKKICYYLQSIGFDRELFKDDLINTIKKFHQQIFRYNEYIDEILIKKIYRSDCKKIIDIYYSNMPIPPLSLFDQDQLPPLLLEREAERKSSLIAFLKRNEGDGELREKIVYLQRCIRAEARTRLAIQRVKGRYFPQNVDGKRKALEMIQQANRPYKPQRCSPELARRIMEAALTIHLFSSVTHLLDATRIAPILDGCLYGRKNLINLYIPFRPAALHTGDVENGDGNVICMGGNKIDPCCLKGRTVGLEFDLNVLLDNKKYKKNRSIFFKQLDLGYDVKNEQILTIGNHTLSFNHTGMIRNQTRHCSSMQLSSAIEDYYAEIERDFLISDNVKDMDAILSLNFFRYLDRLMSMDGSDASSEIARIYGELSKLNDDELRSFMEEVGKKIACSSEFNIYGSYEIDINGLISITLYDKDAKIDSIMMDDLYLQLKEQRFEGIDRLKERLPELFQSNRFIDHLRSRLKLGCDKVVMTARESPDKASANSCYTMLSNTPRGILTGTSRN